MKLFRWDNVLSKARISYSYRFTLVNHLVKQLSESVLSGKEAGSSCKRLHVGSILWQQGINSIPRLNFYPSLWLSGKRLKMIDSSWKQFIRVENCWNRLKLVEYGWKQQKNGWKMMKTFEDSWKGPRIVKHGWKRLKKD